MAHLYVAHMAEEKPRGRDHTETSRIWIVVFLLRGLSLCVVGRPAARRLYIDVGELQVFDRETGNAGNDRSLALRVVEAGEIADNNAPERADLGALFRTTEPRAQAHKEGRRRKIAHGCVGDGEVFKQRAIHRLECVAAETLEHTIGDGDVNKSAI